MSSDKDPPAPPKPRDVVMVHSPVEGGDGYNVLRVRESSVELGEIRALREGQPVHGDVVRLSPRQEHERLFDVEVLVEGPKKALPEKTHAGPAQVATEAYRANWEMIFGGRNKASDAPN